MKKAQAPKFTFNAFTFRVEAGHCRSLTETGVNNRIRTIGAARSACRRVPGVTDWVIYKNQLTRKPDGSWSFLGTELVESTDFAAKEPTE